MAFLRIVQKDRSLSNARFGVGCASSRVFCPHNLDWAGLWPQDRSSSAIGSRWVRKKERSEGLSAGITTSSLPAYFRPGIRAGYGNP